ncbi:MAG: hypothetical protein IID44_06485 [Planctomycetes bacterium]|nr:hypothetical protein [Planctomycetota bacterium]
MNFEDLTVLLAAWTGPGGAAAPQAAVVGSDRLQPVDQNRMNPVTTNVGPGFESDSELDAPRQAATYGSATGVASYRVRRDALRSRPTRRIGRLQAAAVDRAMEEQAMFERRERIFSRRTRRG